jgi:hypothetical protein
MLAMTTRRFRSLREYARFLEKQAAVAIPVGQLALGATSDILGKNVRREYGDQVLPELAEATQIDRVAHGYTANDPLLRDGSLLRDSVETSVGPGWASAHTDEPIALYHEFGYFNVRANQMVVPRQAWRVAMEESIAPIREIVQRLTGIILGFEMATFSDISTRTATHEVSASEVP